MLRRVLHIPEIFTKILHLNIFPSHVLPQIKDAEKKNKELLIELAQLRNEDVVDMIKAMKRESSGGLMVFRCQWVFCCNSSGK
jgi:hypothetical protein